MTRKTLGTRVFKLLRAAEETRSNCISGLRASFEYFFRKYVVILDGVLQGGTSFKGTFRTWKYHFQQFWIDWTFVNWNVTDQRSGITKSNPIFGLFWKSSKRWNIYEQKIGYDFFGHRFGLHWHSSQKTSYFFSRRP